MRAGSLAPAILFSAVLVAATAESRAQRYLVRGYDESSGLPSSHVFAVTQDASGSMWFATRAGVARYDGLGWQSFAPGRGVPRSLQSFHRWDDRSRLWVAPSHMPGLIHRFDGEGWTVITGPDEVTDPTPIVVFDAASRGAEHAVVLGLRDGRLFVWNGTTWSARPPIDSSVFSVSVGDRRVLIGTADGLRTLDLEDPEAGPVSLSSVEDAVWAACPDPRQAAVWLAGPDWIGRLEGDRFTRLVDGLDLHGRVGPGRWVLEPDGQGGVYLANRDRLEHYHPDHGLTSFGSANGLVAPGASDVHVDREGNAWVAGPRGVSKIVSRRFAAYKREHGLFEEEVTAVLERRTGEIVLGHLSGLTFLAETPHAVELPRIDGRRRILDLAEDAEGTLWAAVEGQGLARIDAALEVEWREDVDGDPRSVVADRLGRIWVATEEAVYSSTGKRFEPFRRESAPPAAGIRRLSTGSDDALYFATAGDGVYRHREGLWMRWLARNDPEGNNVYAVLEDASGVVWAGTGNGLYRAQGDELVRSVPRVDRPVYFLVQDRQDRLWIGTDNGVMRRDAGGVEHFTVRDGLVGRETNRAAGLLDSRGHVWIGTERGVSVYRPELDRSEPVPPIVELLELEASDRTHSLAYPVKLPHRDSDVLIRFRAVSFVDEARVQVRTRLEGYDADWLPARTAPGREVRYTNLPPGRYRFHLQAAAARGKWSEVVVSGPITVLAPFYFRGWFLAAALAVLAGAVLATRRYVAQSRYALRLEREVEQRLAERQQIEDELERARRLESLGMLAGGIAHDFNNLMTAILGNLTLIKFEPHVKNASRRNLANAEAAILRARDLTTQLLTFSRGGAPVRETAPIGEVVRESTSFVLSGTKVRCDLDLPDDLWVVDIDAGQMSQVISNLLINAVEAMPEGGVVRVEGRNLEQPPPALPSGRCIEISIRDQGHGIAPEHLERIFDPYFSTKQRGSGLGLATAYSIVNRHDGLLTAESAPDRGTIFRIFLPASESQVAGRPESTERVATGGGRVLVMDDEDAVRNVIGAVLGREGYDVELTENGEQAIARFRRAIDDRRPFDAVILDLTVRGGMGGADAIGELRELDPGVRAIVVSGYSSDPVMAEYHRYGFTGRVRKPFRTEELTRAVREAVRARDASGTRG